MKSGDIKEFQDGESLKKEINNIHTTFDDLNKKIKKKNSFDDTGFER